MNTNYLVTDPTTGRKVVYFDSFARLILMALRSPCQWPYMLRVLLITSKSFKGEVN